MLAQQLHEQAEQFLVAIEAEKGAIETVAEQASLMKRKILHQRKMMGGVNAAKENEHMVQKQVRQGVQCRSDSRFVTSLLSRASFGVSMEHRAEAGQGAHPNIRSLVEVSRSMCAFVVMELTRSVLQRKGRLARDLAMFPCAMIFLASTAYASPGGNPPAKFPTEGSYMRQKGYRGKPRK